MCSGGSLVGDWWVTGGCRTVLPLVHLVHSSLHTHTQRINTDTAQHHIMSQHSTPLHHCTAPSL